MRIRAFARRFSAQSKLWLLTVPLSAAAFSGLAYVFNRYVHATAAGTRTVHESLRLMTWNIGKLYLPVDSRAADRDLRHVAQVIREVEPHIVALQELRDARQLGRLLTELGPEWQGRIPRDLYDRRAALLTRIPTNFVEVGTSTGRRAQAAEVTLPRGGLITVVSVHLDAFDAGRRMRQAEEILASAWRVGHQDVFLAGDFNLDPAIVARDSSDYRLYSFLTKYLRDVGRHEGGTTVISRRLDYIFYRSARVGRVRSRVLHGRRINAMDHRPLVAEFEVRSLADRKPGTRP